MALWRGWGCWVIRPGFTVNDEELVMKWETPQAIDFRFGMEITMYIAHR
ncbi:MAG TPA: pyrroloquinoline quinone precursor peptide PqqA [Steroidobacteraceae bacterium]|nr:pyrroloquinoline quinone precursor peptide PqqA [Steroidobacteraceae bacterium]